LGWTSRLRLPTRTPPRTKVLFWVIVEASESLMGGTSTDSWRPRLGMPADCGVPWALVSDQLRADSCPATTANKQRDARGGILHLQVNPARRGEMARPRLSAWCVLGLGRHTRGLVSAAGVRQAAVGCPPGGTRGEPEAVQCNSGFEKPRGEPCPPPPALPAMVPSAGWGGTSVVCVRAWV